MGARRPGQRTPADLWLVNDGLEPIALESVKPSCGCLRLGDDTPGTLEPGRAVRLALAAAGPEAGKERHARVDVVAGGRRVSAAIHVVADEEAPELRAAEHALLAAAPATLSLGELAPGARVEGSLWLVNTSDAPLELEAAEAGCGCTELAFEPTVLAAGAVLEVPWTVSIKETAKSGAREKRVTILMKGAEQLVVPLAYSVPAAATASTLR